MKSFHTIVFAAFLAIASAKDAIQDNTTADSASNDALIPQLPQEGGNCNPEECINVGYCQGYLRCDKKAGQWVKEECGENLVRNPLNSNGTNQVYGGNCDIWASLSNDIVRRYRTDTDCLACFWRAVGSCSREYDYHPANGTHRNVLRLSCGEGLVFSQEKETCQRCEDVKGTDGNSCCYQSELSPPTVVSASSTSSAPESTSTEATTSEGGLSRR